jgi:hypothetical protein
MGYKPVYSNDQSVLRVTTTNPREVKWAGKIYTIGQLVFQNEIGRGLHVFNYANPAHPAKAGFINILGNTELSVKGNYLYANSFTDLVVINISDWRNPVEAKRIQNAFQQGQNINYNLLIPPPEHNVNYECIDNSKGIHIGWVKDSVDSYSCYYF